MNMFQLLDYFFDNSNTGFINGILDNLYKKIRINERKTTLLKSTFYHFVKILKIL